MAYSRSILERSKEGRCWRGTAAWREHIFFFEKNYILKTQFGALWFLNLIKVILGKNFRTFTNFTVFSWFFQKSSKCRNPGSRIFTNIIYCSSIEDNSSVKWMTYIKCIKFVSDKINVWRAHNFQEGTYFQSLYL